MRTLAVVALLILGACTAQPPPPTSTPGTSPRPAGPSPSAPATPSLPPTPSPTVRATASDTPSPDPEPVPIVTVSFRATRETPCGDGGSCTHLVELTGPDETWHHSLSFMKRPVLLLDLMSAPVVLRPGSYALTAERYSLPNVVPNETPPADALDATCNTSFDVQSGQGPVVARVTFRRDGCAVVVEEQDPPPT